jgi:subtilase family serine protease
MCGTLPESCDGMNLTTSRPFVVTLVLVMLGGCAGARPTLLPGTTVAPSSVVANPLERDIVADVPLQYRSEAQLQEFIARQEELPPGSRRHWLTNEQFDARFAPSPSAYARVVASLQRAGIRVTQRFDNRTVIDAEGGVAALEAYFGTEVHRVEQPGHGIRYANVRAAFAPADVRGLLLSVDGLSTMSTVRLLGASPASGTAGLNAMRDRALKLFGPPNPNKAAVGYGPAALETAYDFPATHPNGGTVYDGSGHASAFIMDADFADRDLATFFKYFGITRSASMTIRVPIDGGAPPGDEALDSVFTTFIAENIAALAPGSRLYAYEVHPGFAYNTITDTYNRVVSDNRVDVVSSPFGNCEAAIATTAKAWDAIAEQGLAKGIVFAAGSGDSGGISCPNAPASSPYFTAVGGTSLAIGRGGDWFSEPGWYASSGGISRVFPMPAWQNGIPGTVAGGRNEPDVAFDAELTTGAAGYIRANGGWFSDINPYGGTGSLAASIYAAALTEINQLKDERTGLGSESLFQIWKNTGYGTPHRPYFHDALEGGSGLYFAVPGYDFVTGIGSVDFWNVAEKL